MWDATDNVRLHAFIIESNLIERIDRNPTDAEIDTTIAFLQLPELRIADVSNLAKVYQPDARLRQLHGMNVTVGDHMPQSGGSKILHRLYWLVRDVNSGVSPWENHCRYLSLHPFTDGNGRSGRAIWLWQMVNQKCDGRMPRLGFLHEFYYQTLRVRDSGL